MPTKPRTQLDAALRLSPDARPVYSLEANAKVRRGDTCEATCARAQCFDELARALGVEAVAYLTWPELIAKVSDLAVTDCAPASQAEQMIWQLAEALGIPEPTPTTWSEMLAAVRMHRDEATKHGAVSLDAFGDLRKVLGATPGESTLQAARRVSGLTDAYPLRLTTVEGEAKMQRLALASLRAELAALNKRVDNVERRARDTPTKAELADTERLMDELRIGLEETQSEVGTLQRRTCVDVDSWQALDERVKRLGIDAGAADSSLHDKIKNLAANVDIIERTSAGKAETIEAVRSLTDALAELSKQVESDNANRGDQIEDLIKAHEFAEAKAQQLEGFCTGLRARGGAREQQADQRQEHVNRRLAQIEEIAVLTREALTKHEAEAIRETAHHPEGDPPQCPAIFPRTGMRCVYGHDHASEHHHPASGARWTTEVSLDLATLRVHSMIECRYAFRVSDGHIEIVDTTNNDHVRCGLTIDTADERLLARALMQDADEREARAKAGGK